MLKTNIQSLADQVLLQKSTIKQLEAQIQILKSELKETHSILFNMLGYSAQIFEKCLEKELLIDNFIQNLPGHLYWKDKDGIYLGCNKGQSDYLGLASPKNIIGKTDFDLAWSFDAEMLRQIDQKVMQSGQIYTIEETITRSKVEYVFLSSKTPLKAPGGSTIGILGISIDVSGLKRALHDLAIAKDKAEASERAKTEFLANISHDIRTPFSGLVAITENLIKHELDAEKLEKLDLVHQASESLLNLFNSILELVDCEEKEKERIESVLFVTRDTITHICNVACIDINLKLHKFELTFDKSVPQKIISYLPELKRILLNLIHNAIKFTEKGVISVTISQQQLEKQDYLHLSVSDTGIGIKADCLDSIFDKFEKTGLSYDQSNTGHGLGLWIVKKLITSIGGKLSVKSTLGAGSTFSCLIPCFAQAYSPKINKIENGQIEMLEEKTGDPFRVLLIEDNMIAQRAAEIIFSEFNCTVTTVETGQKAIHLASEKFDLIFMDVGMPDISGEALLKQLTHLVDHKTPIYALTAHANSKLKQKLVKLGIKQVLEKPLTNKIVAMILPV